MAETVPGIGDVQPVVDMSQSDTYTEFQDQSASNGAEAQDTPIQGAQCAVFAYQIYLRMKVLGKYVW